MKTQKKKKSGSFPFMKVVVMPLIAMAAVAIFWKVGASLLFPPNLANQLSFHPTLQQLREGDCREINSENPGERLELSRFAARGKYTIFDFSSVF